MTQDNKIIFGSAQTEGKLILIKVNRHGWSTQYINNYVLNIIANEDQQDFQYWQNKIINHKYYDLVRFSGKQLKKEDISMLMQRFSQPGIEKPNKKFYIIDHVELCKKVILNALLTFTEQPPKNTFGIFTTNNFNSVLPTIQSRSIKINLPDMKNEIDQFITNEKIDPQLYQIGQQCFYDFDQFQENLVSFKKIYEFCLDLLDQEKRWKNINKFLTIFKKYSYEEIDLLIKIIFFLLPKYQKYFSQFQDHLWTNPNKVLLFHKIIAGLEK